MPKKPNSKNENQHDDSSQEIEELSEDLDFWNIESSSENTEASPEELEEIEEIIAEQKKEQHLKQLSEREINIELPCEKEIMSSLDLHKGGEDIEDLPDISNKNIDELLASATAEAIAEDNENGSITPQSPIKEDKPKKQKPIKSPTEKIATIFCYIAIIGVFGYLIKYASQQHNFDTEKSYAADTPAEGEFAHVENIETWWSEPVGNNTKFGVILVPAATITLSESSTNGVIRSVFYSSEEGIEKDALKPKGDPFTHEFRNGKFLTSGTNQITIYGTDGFKELSNFIFYRGQDDERWIVNIKEAPSIQTQVNSFSYLAQAPIEPIRK